MAAPLEDILQQHPVWRGGAPAAFCPVLSTTYPDLDRALPSGGWPTGVLTELLCNHEGIGELTLALPALAALTWAGKRVVWLAPPHLPYAPALAAAGVDLAQLAIVRCRSAADQLWAYEQALHAPECGAAFAWLGERNDRVLRRLAVAAR